MRRVNLLVLAALLAAGLLVPPLSRAQPAGLCFDVPGITNCIEGRFREYWEQNGGLAVFGYPISAATMQQTADGTFLTQFFERNRFELHPAEPPPYDVLLGRLGDDRLTQLGRNWQTFPKGAETAGCLFFTQTGHSVCNQEGDIGFRSYWESHGLQDPALSQVNRSLALFGFPLSEPAMETNAAGATVLTQWFERARFEFHPGNPSETRVLLGLLGNETSSASPPAPAPAPGTPPPAGACGGILPPVDATIEPNCVKAGATLTVEVSGFAPNQELKYWITDEPGFLVAPPQTARSDAQGRLRTSVDTRNFSDVALGPGNYEFVARDVEETILPARAPFRVVP